MSTGWARCDVLDPSFMYHSISKETSVPPPAFPEFKVSPLTSGIPDAWWSILIGFHLAFNIHCDIQAPIFTFLKWVMMLDSGPFLKRRKEKQRWWIRSTDRGSVIILCTRTQLGLLRWLLTVLAPAILIPFLELFSSPLDGPGGPECMVYKRIIAWEVNRRSWNVLLCNCGGGWLVVNNTCGVVRCRTQCGEASSKLGGRS